jgi:hypothetical protein
MKRCIVGAHHAQVAPAGSPEALLALLRGVRILRKGLVISVAAAVVRLFRDAQAAAQPGAHLVLGGALLPLQHGAEPLCELLLELAFCGAREPQAVRLVSYVVHVAQ